MSQNQGKVSENLQREEFGGIFGKGFWKLTDSAALVSREKIKETKFLTGMRANLIFA
jgi:hypothetical protein